MGKLFISCGCDIIKIINLYRKKGNLFKRRLFMKSTLDSKYKDMCPTLEEFSLVGVDFQKIEQEFEDYQKHRKNFGYYFWSAISVIASFGAFLGGIALVIIIVLMGISVLGGSSSLLGGESYINVLIGYFAFVTISILIYYFSNKIASGIYNKPFNNQKTYDNIHAYTDALAAHVMWQERKKKDYWYNLSGREFELGIADLFEKQGWVVKVCKQGGDGGIDIEASTEGKRLAIQCKAHKNKVPPSVARDLLGTAIAGHYNAACLITLEGGTAGTVEFCQRNGIVLWDINNILNFQKKI